jgi:hypothetical protein
MLRTIVLELTLLLLVVELTLLLLVHTVDHITKKQRGSRPRSTRKAWTRAGVLE